VAYARGFLTWEGFKERYGPMFWSIGECLNMVAVVALVTL